jgi:hypothetical protein
MSYLRIHKPFEIKNVRLFREELNDLGTRNPIVIAFGGDAYTLLTRNFENEYTVFKIPHYSNYCSKEKYREQISRILQYE